MCTIKAKNLFKRVLEWQEKVGFPPISGHYRVFDFTWGSFDFTIDCSFFTAFYFDILQNHFNLTYVF